jgi:hypothetical protein
VPSNKSFEGSVNGLWLRAAGAGRQCAPAALIGASGRRLNFTIKRPMRLPGGCLYI